MYFILLFPACKCVLVADSICLICSRWSYTYGVGSLAAVTGFVAGYFNKHYRRALNMRNNLLVSTTLAVVTVPMILVYSLHLTFVTGDILIRKTKCAVCLETRSMLIQCSCVLYPILLSSVVNIPVCIDYVILFLCSSKVQLCTPIWLNKLPYRNTLSRCTPYRLGANLDFLVEFQMV